MTVNQLEKCSSNRDQPYNILNGVDDSVITYADAVTIRALQLLNTVMAGGDCKGADA